MLGWFKRVARTNAVRLLARLPPGLAFKFLMGLSEARGRQILLFAGATTFHACGRFEETVEIISQIEPHLRSRRANLLLSRSLFELGQFKRAQTVLASVCSDPSFHFDSTLAHFKGLLDLITDKEHEADSALRAATIGMPHLMAPHQNLAARMPEGKYRPSMLDRTAGRNGRLFDAYNYIGQRVIHVGRGDLGTELFARALESQRQLRSALPAISSECQKLLDDLEVPLEELRIFGPEWSSQIGHQGLLDVQLRMRELGWWTGSPVLLAPHDRIANFAFLSLFERHVKLLTVNGNVHRRVAAELTSLQRYFGMSFNAFELKDGRVVPWCEAGAMAVCKWESERRSPLLQKEFDRKFENSEAIKSAIAHLQRDWGMAPEDWYACLHLRDASFYKETAASGQSHRNTPIENYRAAIEHITSRGGWVIKLGGPASPRLPPMPHLVDYSRSAYKSELMDIYLIRNARFFIGTTSGLTNAVISMGIPAALVNCISTDAQLWSSQVRFVPKAVKLADGRRLTQHELTTSPWRWRLFDAAVMKRHGATPIENDPDEILEAVIEAAALAENKLGHLPAVAPASSLITQWRESLGLPYFYGGALPSVYYLKKHKDEFLAK